MRVLVTGAGGYIGSITVERLIEAGHDVVALDSLQRGHRQAIHPDAEFVEVDLRDAGAVVDALAPRRLEAICHFAALHLVPESVEQPAAYYRNNILGGLNLLDAAREAEIPRFVFSSTAAVYGEPESSPIFESALKLPINPYGRTKWMIEQILEDYSARYPIHYAAFRFFNVAGATAERGEDHRPETHVIPLALQVLQGKRPVFKIMGTDYLTPDGTAVRDYVHVSDLADAHILALAQLDSASIGAMNLGTMGGYSVREIADAVSRVVGRELPVEDAPRRAGDPAALVADPARALNELGWNPQQSNLDDMIGSAWDWMNRYPNGYVD
ncbi:MAG: UDP-glucose 4-epimerase GalE [Thermomicrobiales bacterium]